jgi:peptidoglycan-N-acetylglucosamine deacetylase
MVTFTLDLEDHRPNEKYEKRYPEITRQILELLDHHSVKATFFTVGTIVKSDPDLIKDISSRGHELAFHSYGHRQLQHEKPEQFLQETKQGKQDLEDITGQNVIGFRAPVFSITKQTLWALDVLSDLDFKYSSSVLPAANPLNGFPGAPETPFFWPNGLLEIPVPVTRVGPITIPYLGGVYLRYLPKFLIKYLINKNQAQTLWTYCHPYDFDPSEPFFKIKDAHLLTSLILWFNRSNTKEKISFLLSMNQNDNNGCSFSEQFQKGDFESSPTFNV